DLLADSPGAGGAESLTAQQLQPAVTQAIDAWRAAGIDAQSVSALERAAVHLANLPGGVLGIASPGEIWIDRTAAGWGWSSNGACGRVSRRPAPPRGRAPRPVSEHGGPGGWGPGPVAGWGLPPEPPASTSTAASPAPPADPVPAPGVVSHAAPLPVGAPAVGS